MRDGGEGEGSGWNMREGVGREQNRKSWDKDVTRGMGDRNGES